MKGASASKTDGGFPDSAAHQHGARAGLVYGLSAYTLWGIFPIYFKALAAVPPLVILCHRIVWSALCLATLVSLKGEWSHIWPLLRNRRSLTLLSAGSLLIAVNWLIFIYAVTSKQVLQASLGYFINPLVSVALGMVFLGERLRKWQWVAVSCAVLAVCNLALKGAGFPWIAVSLAVTFGFYGLVRKKVDTNSLHALLIESSMLVPAAGVLLFLLPAGELPKLTWGLLSLSGIITAVPLLLFGAALRRLQLSTIGFMQYIGPTLQFLLAWMIFREPLDHAKLFSFGLCWAATAVYVIDSLLSRRALEVADEPE